MTDGHKSVVLIAALIGAAATLLAGWLWQGGVGPQAEPTSVTTTETVTAPTVTIPITVRITRTVDSTGAGGGASQPPSQAEYLDGLDPIGDSLFAESASWGFDKFAHSLVDPLSGCDEVGPVDWVIPPGESQLLAEIGVATDSQQPDARVTFNVYVDSKLVFTKTLGVSQHQPLAVDLAGGARLRLETIIDKNRQDNCGSDADAVWGNVRFAA